MTHWVYTRSEDGIKTFMAMIAEDSPEGARINRWLQAEGSIPYMMDFHNVPVLAFQYLADGPVATAPFWSTARLRLKKYWAPDYRSVLKEVTLRLNDVWTYEVHQWADTGVPRLSHSFPRRTTLPRMFRLVLPAVLIQAGRNRHVYDTRRHLRGNSGDGDDNVDSDNNGGPGGNGGRRGQVAT